VQRQCPLSGAKRTCRFALHMSAYDPKRTSVVPLTGPSHLALAAAAPRCASRKIRRQCCGASISGPRPLPLGNAARRGDVWWWQRLTTIVHAFFCSRSQFFTRVTKVKWARRLSVAGKSQSSRHLTVPKNKGPPRTSDAPKDLRKILSAGERRNTFASKVLPSVLKLE
jgi:hypothetical protein